METSTGGREKRFLVGQRYARKEVLAILGLDEPKGGTWYTGLAAHAGEWFIFCGVGTRGRTGHDYGNHFVGDELVWYGRTGSKATHDTIREISRPGSVVNVFFRNSDREAFTYAGRATARLVESLVPVRITWSFASDAHPHAEFPPEEIRIPSDVVEGARKPIVVNVYERDPAARNACIAYWGARCQICDFDFASTYGELGRGFIHVHHLVPLATIGREYAIDPITDLRPVCPNCHAMLLRTTDTMSIEALRAVIRRQES